MIVTILCHSIPAVEEKKCQETWNTESLKYMPRLHYPSLLFVVLICCRQINHSWANSLERMIVNKCSFSEALKMWRIQLENTSLFFPSLRVRSAQAENHALIESPSLWHTLRSGEWIWPEFLEGAEEQEEEAGRVPSGPYWQYSSTWHCVVRLGWFSDQKSHQSSPDLYRSVLGQKNNQ